MRCYFEGQAWCSGESCLTESPCHGFKAASPQILRGNGLPRFFPSPDPTHVGASVTGSALPWELSSLLVCLNFLASCIFVYAHCPSLCILKKYIEPCFSISMLMTEIMYHMDLLHTGYSRKNISSHAFLFPCIIVLFSFVFS